jgi:hypothetical protein
MIGHMRTKPLIWYSPKADDLRISFSVTFDQYLILSGYTRIGYL